MAIETKKQFIDQFRKRTKKFSTDAVSIFRSMPKTEEARIIGKQFLRSALSVGSNYHAACRARSRNEFFSKLSITIEEADETIFWVEIMNDTKLVPSQSTSLFHNEAAEIIKVLAKARKTLS